MYPDNFTYPFLLKACSGPSSLRIVQTIHNQIEKNGFCSDIYVPNALIDSYSRCGFEGVCAARKLFMVMEDKDVVSWNSIIGGLVRWGELEEALHLFDEMPERDSVSWNTILDGYAKTGDMEMARMLFEKMSVKNLVPWIIIIYGYAVKGLAKEAIGFYDRVEEGGLKPDDGTIISILAACAKWGLLGLGKENSCFYREEHI